MKSLFTLLTPILVFMLPLSLCAQHDYSTPGSDKAIAIMKEMTLQGVPGITVAIRTQEGLWMSNAGYASLEDKTPMTSDHLQYIQSISKTYMAVGILKLVEQGKVALDSPITHYLKHDITRYIAQANAITVRMLLNHTSGIPEYGFEAAYVSRLLQRPGYAFKPTDYLRYIGGKPLSFKPGTRYSYRNTNYVLLALLGDALTGDHAQFLNTIIFTPLALNNTFYRNHLQYLTYTNLVNCYWDRYSDGVVENVTTQQRNNVASLIGDDGIVTTPQDGLAFLQGLMEGKLVSPETVSQMKVWARRSNGEPAYGLGLAFARFAGYEAHGHSGGGIGAGCQLYYFPQKNAYVFIAINLGTVTSGPLHKKLEPKIDELYHALLDPLEDVN